ncbi:MAG TPA: SurA N-terminal domain-containing protein [Phycisphaerae bacterium]|nr:SurA N-terminal domain-containing protein [Phycisphaerae bacterium]
MMKWFRAHTKQIMVVVVLLAMFSFVGGSALVTFLQPDPAKAAFGEAFGTEFTQGEIGEAQRDVSAMETVFGFGTPEEYRRQYGTIWQFGRKDLSFIHWYLLAKEAERAGIEVSDQEIDEQFQNFPPDFMEQLRTRFRIIPAELRRALRRQLSIEKNGRRVMSAAVPSEAQIRHYVKETEEKTKVRFVALDAEKFIDEKEPVTAEEVAAQFEKYKDLDPAKSEDGYGYRYPPRVKLQYIVAQIPLIAPGVEISQEAIRSTWKANKAKYKKVIYVDPPTSAPATSAPTTGPTSQPAKPQPVPQTVEKNFSEAQSDVERELRQKAAQQAADQALRKIQTYLQRPWLDEKTDPKTGFKPIPESAKDPAAMKAAYERFSAEFKIPLEYGETPLVTRDELAKMKIISGAILEGAKGAGESLRIEEYAFHVPPLFVPSEASETTPSLQLFQVPDLPLSVSSYQFAGGAFESTIQKFVLFRVVEARESAAPVSLDEVRADVERDVRLMKAFRRAEPIARELFVAGRRLGLEPAFGLFTDLREKYGASVSTPPPFARLTKQTDPRLRDKILSDEPTLDPPSVPGVGVSREFVQACFEMASDDWSPPPIETPKSERMDAATTRPAVLPTPKVRMVGLPAQKKWLVVELIATEPVDEGQYQTKHRQTAYYGLMSERNLVLRNEWYKPEHIEKRCGFKRIAPDGEISPVEGVSRPPPTPYF